jgi:hypothetical protein
MSASSLLTLTPPANRMDVVLVDGLYGAWTVINDKPYQERWFTSLDKVITHARTYPGVIFPCAELVDEMRAAGLMVW